MMETKKLVSMWYIPKDINVFELLIIEKWNTMYLSVIHGMTLI